MQTIVIYSSQTGNTRKLATQIFAAIPGDSKDLKNIDEYREKDAELYFVGFWVDRGDCDEKTVELLSGLHGKKIALFGTCGMGNDPAYYQKVIDRVKTWIPEDNEYIDSGAQTLRGNGKEWTKYRTDSGYDPKFRPGDAASGSGR